MSDYKNIIDVSYCQGAIDWSKVNVDAVIIRAGYGRLASQRDTYFDRNYQGAKSRGIPVGVYWYSYAMNEAEAELEAEACLQVIKGGQYEYPIYYDVEESKQFALGRTAVSKIIRAFLSKVEAAGYWVGLYGSYSSLTTYTDPDIRSRYAVWLAHWGVTKSPYTGAYGLWQTGVGRTAGINGDVDIDRGYVDYPTLIKNAGLNGFQKQSAQPTAEQPKEKEPEKKYECPYPIPATTLKKGDKGNGVKWVQFNLKHLGYDIGKYGIDGDFGSATDAAVRKFQKDAKIEVDGICGPKTKAVIIAKIYDITGSSQAAPRLTKPEAGNPYYNTISAGGYSGAIVGNPTDSGCNVLANCVGYAAGRFNEIIGADKFMYLQYPPNAENFYDVAQQQGLKISQKPQFGAIMCWQKGATRSGSDGAGHVAVVEQVISDTEVVTSESGYGCKTPFWTASRKKGNGNWGAGAGYKFLGFILNPAVKG